jgi:hypothetical protein
VDLLQHCDRIAPILTVSGGSLFSKEIVKATAKCQGHVKTTENIDDCSSEDFIVGKGKK